MAYCVINGALFTVRLTFADLCHVTVETCCILHNFVRETAFSFNIHYTNVPSILEATEMLLITTGRSCFSVSARTGN